MSYTLTLVRAILIGITLPGIACIFISISTTIGLLRTTQDTGVQFLPGLLLRKRRHQGLCCEHDNKQGQYGTNHLHEYMFKLWF